MDEEQKVSGPLRVGMRWGGIGGVVGLAMSLFLPYLGGLLGAAIVGVACGRRSVGSDEESATRAGLVSGALAAPVFALGAAVGTLLAVRQVEMESLSSTASEAAGIAVTAQDAWSILLVALVIIGLMQVAALILTSVLAAGRTAKKAKKEE